MTLITDQGHVTPPECRMASNQGHRKGGQGGTMTPGPMEFLGPMSSTEAHRNFCEDLFFGDHLILTVKTARISVKTFFYVFGDHIIMWTKLEFTTSEMQHISAGSGPTFGSRRPCCKYYCSSVAVIQQLLTPYRAVTEKIIYQYISTISRDF